MAFDRSRSIPEPINESDDEPDLSLFEVDWEDPEQVKALMAKVDADIDAETDPNDQHTRWRQEDRQHRINDWGAAFFQGGIIPPNGWEDWVK